MKATRSKSDAAGSGSPLRQKLLEIAADCLIEEGVAGTTTLAVQHKAGVSRGALLYHFPTHTALLAAAITTIVERNERSVADSLERLHGAEDPLELWAVSRTDKTLRSALVAAERSARRDIERVYSNLFGAWAKLEAFDEVVLLTQTFISGLAISENIRSSPKRRERAIAAWSKTIRSLLENSPKKKAD